MVTFDDILPRVTTLLRKHREFVDQLDWLVVNRDLNSRVRLIVPAELEAEDANQSLLEALVREVEVEMAPHGYIAADGVLYESTLADACDGACATQIEEFKNVWFADRLATEGDWSAIADEAPGAARIVFFSIKGGVGRSAALAALALTMAQSGMRVLVLDLDLESPGLSTSLLPEDRQPEFGITDWLVEDLVDNGIIIIESMISTSNLSRDGEIFIVPAHGRNPGEYVSKLARVWMPKVNADGSRENWSKRLQRLIANLETKIRPDVILIDSRAGIDEVAASCVTDLGARLVLLFAIDGSQTWGGYRILFDHWGRSGVVTKIRDRLQVVAAMVPELDRLSYIDGLREGAYNLFSEFLYDEVPPGEPASHYCHFETSDEAGPHYPLIVNWHRGFAGVKTLHGRLVEIDDQELRHIFGSLIDGVMEVTRVERSHE